MGNSTSKYSCWYGRGERQADWREAYAIRSVFEVADAAHILAGVQPEYGDSSTKAANIDPEIDKTWPEVRRDIESWTNLLLLDLDELIAKNGYSEREDAQFFHLLDHGKIRLWCSERGYYWPLPQASCLPVPVSTDSAEQELQRVREALQEAEQRALAAERELNVLRDLSAKGTPNDGCLLFPYRTQALQAAQDAATRFWIDYDIERPPLQKAVSQFIAERLGRAKNRTTDELAAVIRPDGVDDSLK